MFVILQKNYNMIRVKNKLMFHVSKCRDFQINKIYDTNSKDFTHGYSRANDSKVLMEENLESYRIQNRPNYPSRKQCLFVTEMEDLDYWFHFFRKEYPKSKIYGVELTGELFIADSEMMNEPEKYWNGDVSELHLCEGILSGQFRIEGQYFLGMTRVN